MADRLLTLYKSQSESLGFAKRLSAGMKDGDLDAVAETKFGKEIGHLGRVITAGLTAYRTSPKATDSELTFDSVARALERQGQREVMLLRRGQGVLATVGATAPFVGLLGTVMGIVNAFQKMAAAGSGGLGTVSAGIAEALVTTAFGLLVAIPAVLVYNALQAYVDARSVDISESSNELLDVVARHTRGAKDEPASELRAAPAET
jgi:biopolymer transport protein ExbB/biopolymer transport protein TolQ